MFLEKQIFNSKLFLKTKKTVQLGCKLQSLICRIPLNGLKIFDNRLLTKNALNAEFSCWLKGSTSLLLNINYFAWDFWKFTEKALFNHKSLETLHRFNCKSFKTTSELKLHSRNPKSSSNSCKKMSTKAVLIFICPRASARTWTTLWSSNYKNLESAQ